MEYNKELENKIHALEGQVQKHERALIIISIVILISSFLRFIK